MRQCKNCKWWHEDQLIKDISDNDKIKMAGCCDRTRIRNYMQAWHTQDLPAWLNIIIAKSFYPLEDFGCNLWEQNETATDR